jgi:hypothetical protein
MTEQTPQDVIIGAVLDMSYSMSSSRPGTVSGFDEFRNQQASQPGNAWLTLVVFDDVVEMPYVAWNCRDIPDLSEEVYMPRGNTALYDGYAATIQSVDEWLVANSWFSGKVVIMVMTDGMENASKKFSQSAVQRLSRAKKEAGWEFVVFGANVEAQAVARQLGIEPDRAHQYEASAHDSAQVFAAASFATTSSRLGDSNAYAGTLRSFRSKQVGGDEVSPGKKTRR